MNKCVDCKHIALMLETTVNGVRVTPHCTANVRSTGMPLYVLPVAPPTCVSVRRREFYLADDCPWFYERNHGFITQMEDIERMRQQDEQRAQHLIGWPK